MPQLQHLSTLPAHSDPAWCVAFNPSRPLLASCSTDRTFRVYSYILPQPVPLSLRSQASHSVTEETSTISPTAPSVPSPAASSACSGPVFPRPSDPKPIFSLQSVVRTEHKRTIRSLSWAPSGRTLATGSFDSSVGVWEEVDGSEAEGAAEGNEGVYRPDTHEQGGDDEMNGGDQGDEDQEAGGEGREGGKGGGGKEWECVTTLEGHDSECKDVAWSGDGGLLASCSRDKSVWVWEVQPDSDFECIAVMMEHSQDVKCLAWHPKEEILASASYDSHIHLLFDDPDGDWCVFQKLHPKIPASPLTIPSTSSPHLIRNLSPNAEEQAVQSLQIPPLVEDETVWSLAWSPDGRYLASGGDLGGIRIWYRKGHQPDSQFEEVLHTAAHSRSCFTLSWSLGGMSEDEGGLGLLASGGGDGKIVVWQVSKPTSDGVNGDVGTTKPSMRPVAAMRDAHGVSDVNHVAWCVREGAKGQGLLASAGDDGSVKVWRIVEDE